MHSQTIYHRDIKPSNIMFDDQYNPVLIDFGLSSIGKKKINEQCGTPGFMAPEILNLKNYGEKCDIYSLGITFFILIFGYNPLKGDDK